MISLRMCVYIDERMKVTALWFGLSELSASLWPIGPKFIIIPMGEVICGKTISWALKRKRRFIDKPQAGREVNYHITD